MPPRTLKLTILPQIWHERPKTRGDCEGGERPCPWISCRHHLALDVTLRGDLTKPFAFDENDDGESIAVMLEERKQTCALDVAEDGEHTLEEVGELIGVTRQRVEAIEHVAQRRARAARERGEAKAEWKRTTTHEWRRLAERSRP